MLSLPIVAILLGVVLLVILFSWLIPLKLIFSAVASKLPISPIDLIGMKIRGINPHVVVNAAIRLSQAGIELKPTGLTAEEQRDDELITLTALEQYGGDNLIAILESHMLAGGNPDQLATGLIEAKKRRINLPFSDASCIVIGGGNIIRVVAALEEARRRNVELSIKEAISVELALSKKAGGSHR